MDGSAEGGGIAFGKEAFAKEGAGGVGVEGPEADVEVGDGEAAIRE